MIEEWIKKLKKAEELIIEVEAQMSLFEVKGWTLNHAYNYLIKTIKELEERV